MKKFLFLFLTLMVTSVVFVSCSSDDDDDNQYNSAIVGTWKITEVKTSQSGTYIDWPFRTTYASFNSDGTYYGFGYFGTGNGTWSIKGNTVNTYVGGELYASYEIISMTSTSAELKMSMDGEAIWIKCKKE
ncbi:MAG: lipocalin family protein [Prevotella sp.]